MSVEAVQEAQVLWEVESPRHKSRLSSEDTLIVEDMDQAAEDDVTEAVVEPVEQDEAADVVADNTSLEETSGADEKGEE